jgi:hypothetical protein
VTSFAAESEERLRAWIERWALDLQPSDPLPPDLRHARAVVPEGRWLVDAPGRGLGGAITFFEAPTCCAVGDGISGLRMSSDRVMPRSPRAVGPGTLKASSPMLEGLGLSLSRPAAERKYRPADGDAALTSAVLSGGRSLQCRS